MQATTAASKVADWSKFMTFYDKAYAIAIENKNKRK